MFFLCQLSRRYMVRESDWACAYGIWKTHLTDTWLTDCNYKWISSIISSGRIAIIFQKCLWDWIINSPGANVLCGIQRFDLENSICSAVSQLIHLLIMITWKFQLGQLSVNSSTSQTWRFILAWRFSHLPSDAMNDGNSCLTDDSQEDVINWRPIGRNILVHFNH